MSGLRSIRFGAEDGARAFGANDHEAADAAAAQLRGRRRRVLALAFQGRVSYFLPSHARATRAATPPIPFLGFCRQPIVPPAERDADRAAELRRRSRWPPAPPICRYGHVQPQFYISRSSNPMT
jgi:hypothetical protein